jgi:hypothetical protein
MNLEIISAGTAYSLSDGTLTYLLGYSGCGMAPQTIISEKGPMQHGDTHVGFRLAPRTVQLALELPATSLATLETAKANLMAIFTHGNDLTLRWTQDNGNVRDLACVFAGDMDMASADKLGYHQNVGVTLRAADPTWYDPAAVTLNFGLTPGGDAMDVPLAIPWKVGRSGLNQTITFTYGGTFRSYPWIRIVGPVTDCAITNDTTGETLDFDGVTIAADHYYDVDCAYGVKTVTDNHGTNKIADLTAASDLASFHIAAHPEAVSGINDITVTGTSVTAATQVYMRYYTRYVGV